MTSGVARSESGWVVAAGASHADGIAVLLAAALALMGSPGPATLRLAAIGSRCGFRRKLGWLGGIVLGAAGVLAALATGATGVLMAPPGLAVAIQGAALVYILLLASAALALL